MITDPQPKPATVYVHQPYPRLLYKPGERRQVTVRSEEEEERFAALGWGRTPWEPPPSPAPVSETDFALARQQRDHLAEMETVRDRHATALLKVTEQHRMEMEQANQHAAALVEDLATRDKEIADLQSRIATLKANQK